MTIIGACLHLRTVFLQCNGLTLSLPFRGSPSANDLSLTSEARKEKKKPAQRHSTPVLSFHGGKPPNPRPRCARSPSLGKAPTS
ncbi:hypothetical protein BKA61DRAFT_617804 [Leptodontidium sp. MPI-SDFR-AT-0119]|nr:hypothetical protein BKA61DRAFT_617804 [Leptodontidium sp. MPI-SDFR-AT-0119]